MNNLEIEPYDAKTYSEEKKQKMLDDLRLVGDQKPIGYLPIATLAGTCGVNPKDMRVELEAKGLIVLELSGEESNIYSGAFFVYSHEALSRALQSGRSILERNGWPTEPEAFVRHLNVLAEDKDLYKLVMQTFADPRLQNQ